MTGECGLVDGNWQVTKLGRNLSTSNSHPALDILRVSPQVALVALRGLCIGYQDVKIKFLAFVSEIHSWNSST